MGKATEKAQSERSGLGIGIREQGNQDSGVAAIKANTSPAPQSAVAGRPDSMFLITFLSELDVGADVSDQAALKLWQPGLTQSQGGALRNAREDPAEVRDETLANQMREWAILSAASD